MTTTIKVNALALPTLLFLILAITAFSYWGGLNSAFLFDDLPNMESIGQHANLGGWRDLALYLLNGDIGPLGRPLSLASFYLNDQTWKGMNPADFKYTNLMIHLLNGVMIFWLCLKLSPKLPLSPALSRWLPAIVTTAWLLNPMQTNTVLYAVQRMTELSTLFTLTGLLCYVHGRELLTTYPRSAWLWLVGGGGLSLFLALLSKENGALLVVYVLVLEYCLLRPHGHAASRLLQRALLAFAWLPLVLLLLMLVKWGWIDQTNRPFSTGERLLTEARIIWDYLSHIVLPRMGDNSLLHDDFTISKGLLTPVSTLPAVLGVLGLGIGALIIRQRQPVLAFSILWFLGGHLLESTSIALELYFDHRNYLPMLGLVFGLVYYSLYAMQQQEKLRRAIPLLLTIYLGLMVLVTHSTAQRWTDPVRLIAGWLDYHPQSQRTLEALDAVIGEHISHSARQKLLDELNQVAQQQGNNAYLVFRDLDLACTANQLTTQTLQQAVEQLREATFVASTPTVFAQFVHNWNDTHCGAITPEQMVTFIKSLYTLPHLQAGDMPYILHYWQAEVHVQQGNLAEAMLHMDTSYSLHKDMDLLLLQASYLMSAGLYTEADSKLANAEQDFCTNWRSCLTLKLRQPDVDNLRSALQDKLKQEKANNHAQAINYSARQE